MAFSTKLCVNAVMLARSSKMISISEKKRILPFWAWPTALSLDAPIVAIAWQSLFLKVFGSSFTVWQFACLFLTVWLIYSADRLLDSKRLDLTQAHTLRHAFYARHHKAMLIIWIFLLLLTAVISFSFLNPTVILIGLFALALCLLYGLAVHRFTRFIRFSKELQVGFLFAIGCSLVAWSQSLNSGFSLLPLLSATVAFACLCTFNCLLIALAEQNLDKLQNQLSFATQAVLSQRYLSLLLFGFVGLSLGLGLWLQSSFYLAILLAAFGLWLLSVNMHHLDSELLRVLADVVLLSPLVIALVY